MKTKSLTQLVIDRHFGKLRAFITLCDCGGNGKLFYVGHIYGAGDDDVSHLSIKKRSVSALLKAMEKKLTAYNRPSPK